MSRAILMRGFHRWPKTIETKIRPKGLGLGAETETSAQREHAKRIEKVNGSKEPLVVKSGAYVKILRGAHEGKYGQVSSTSIFGDDQLRDRSPGQSNASIVETVLINSSWTGANMF